MGTPIRLVRNDGGIIELMATTLTMNVDRGVSPLSIPFGGGNRYAFDLNLPKSLITVEGVMTDDDILNMNSIGQDATGIIDFSRRSDRIDTGIFAQEAVIDPLVENTTLNSPATTDNYIQFNPYGKVYLAKQNSSFEGKTAGGLHYIAIHDGTSPRTAVQMAASLHALITSYSADLQLSSTIINSPINGEINTAVELTNINQAAAGNGVMSFPYPGYLALPYHVQFKGGRNTSQVTNKSAGDKVAELFAVLNNSNNGGGGYNSTFGAGNSVLKIATLGAGGASASDVSGHKSRQYGDYIIAIQIPFTSNVRSNESLFYMPTGPTNKITDKTVNNALAAGTEFKESNSKYTGIKGAVANATFVQLGGEPIYSYTINFTPVDFIF